MSNLNKIPKINLHSRLIPGTEFIVTVRNRFYAKVLLPNEGGCMEWTASTKHKKPYGNFIVSSKRYLAHRFSYWLHYDYLPNDMLVLHNCDNPRCVAPDHLRLGSYKENAKDTTTRERWNDRKGSKHPSVKLTVDQVIKIKELLKSDLNQIQIAKMFNVHQGTISRIKIGKRVAI